MSKKGPLCKEMLFLAVIMLCILSWRTSSFGYEWSKTFGGSGNEVGNSVQQTADGGFIITGWTSPADVYLIKTDGSGNEQWSKTFGGSSWDYGYSVQQTADGGFIIVGQTDSFGAGSNDVYLIKTDGSGNEQWSKTFGGSGDEVGNSVQQTTDGGFIIAGGTQSFGVGVPRAPNVYLIKTDGSGNEQWSKSFGGGIAGNSVRQTADGGFTITGEKPPLVSGTSDIYLLKIDGSGNEQWRRSFGGSDGEYGSSVQQTADGGFIIAGWTRSGAGDYDVYLIYYKPGGEFVDVPPGYWAEDAIYKIYEAGITTGCSQNPLRYCPLRDVSRAAMAVFLGRGIHGSGFTPLQATGIFADVPVSYWAADWIEQFYDDGITTGCGTNPLRYCPERSVTRAAMAVFLLRAKYGNNYTPPPATGIFEDVPVTHWAAAWIEQLYAEGITTGCSTNPLRYCPDRSVRRDAMAVFIARTFGL